MDRDEIQLMEHMAAASPLPLKEFCVVARSMLDLALLEYDAANETGWGVSLKEGHRRVTVPRPPRHALARHNEATPSPLRIRVGAPIIRSQLLVAPTTAPA